MTASSRESSSVTRITDFQREIPSKWLYLFLPSYVGHCIVSVSSRARKLLHLFSFRNSIFPAMQPSRRIATVNTAKPPTQQHTTPMRPAPPHRGTGITEKLLPRTRRPGCASDACESGRFALERNFIPLDNWILGAADSKASSSVLGLPSHDPRLSHHLGVPRFPRAIRRRTLRGNLANSTLIVFCVRR